MKAFDMCVYENRLIPPMELPDDYFTGIFQVIFSSEPPDLLEMKMVSSIGEVPVKLRLKDGKYSYLDLSFYPVLIQDSLKDMSIENLPKDCNTYILEKRDMLPFERFCIENNMSIIIGY